MSVSVATLKKIFPEPNDGIYENLSIDNQGLYSITHPKEANIISNGIIEITGTNQIYLVDMTAGCGGNMISFINFFDMVDGYEIDIKRYEMLKTNLQKYNKKNNYKVFNKDCIEELNKYYTYDVYFIDPPWGGPEYKNNNNLELYLSSFTLEEIIKNKIPKNKLIVIKVPFNYNINWCKDFIINKIFLNNIIILFLKLNL